MGFVIGGFLGLAIVAGTIWLAVYLLTHRGERRRWNEEALRVARERLLRTPNARLRCEACANAFAGPMPEDGCPQCHCATFVVEDLSEPATVVAVATSEAGDSEPLKVGQSA